MKIKTIAVSMMLCLMTMVWSIAPVRADNSDVTDLGDPDHELTGQTEDIDFSETPLGRHGALHLSKVDGYGNAPVIVDKNGKPFQLRGASSHGIQWDVGYNYVNKGAYQSLRDEWGVNLVRISGYVTQGGYTQGSAQAMDQVYERGVSAASELGLYVMIDWHIHQENPHDTKAAAKEFFTKYAQKYASYDNVLYEICNEPTNVKWYTDGANDLYAYCREIAGVIRQYDKDALIICGTNMWSQEIDDVAQKPLSDDGFENILYSLHFYAATHYDDLKNRLKSAVDAGTPVYITEFGVCRADGNSPFDTDNATSWIELADSYNISYTCWSLCNKDEGASYLKSSCSKTEGGWVQSDLADTGLWLVKTYRKHQEAEEAAKKEVDSSLAESDSDPANKDGSLSEEPDSDHVNNDGSSTSESGSDSDPGNKDGSSTAESETDTGNKNGSSIAEPASDPGNIDVASSSDSGSDAGAGDDRSSTGGGPVILPLIIAIASVLIVRALRRKK